MIFYLLAAVGATLIVVRGTIFSRLRRLHPALLGCSMCTGFWVGALFGALGLGNGLTQPVWSEPVNRWFDPNALVERAAGALSMACAVSLVAIYADAVLLKLLGDPSE